MGLVTICVRALFSLLQISCAGRVGCGECGAGGASAGVAGDPPGSLFSLLGAPWFPQWGCGLQ